MKLRHGVGLLVLALAMTPLATLTPVAEAQEPPAAEEPEETETPEPPAPEEPEETETPEPPAVEETVVRYEHDEIQAGRLRIGFLRARQRIRDFVDARAGEGRLVDRVGVRVSELDDDLDIVWERGLDIEAVEYGVARLADGDGTAVAELLGVESHNDDDDAVSEATQGHEDAYELGAGGLGLNVLTGIPANTRLVRGYCSTIRSPRNNTQTDCFDKYKVIDDGSTRFDRFLYNRWVTSTGRDMTPYNWVPTRIDLRSRPWSTKAGDVTQLNDYAPKAGQPTCNGNPPTVGVSGGGVSATIPIQDCRDIVPEPNAAARSMGVIYDQGAVFTGRSHGTDFAMVVSTVQGKEAVMADYTYTKFCYITYATCDGALRKDSGW